MARYNCVLFDFDGTTADTIGSVLHTFHHVFTNGGFEIDDEFIATNMGFSLREAFTYIIGDDKKRVAECIRQYEAFYTSEAWQLIRLFPHVLETLARLNEAGVTLCIATNNLHRIVDRISEHLGMATYMQTIVCLDDVVNGKPAPDIALEALRRTGYTAAETLVVGDSTFDVGMGQAAGIDTCAVTYGSHDRATLSEAGATYIIDSFDKLVDIVLND